MTFLPLLLNELGIQMCAIIPSSKLFLLYLFIVYVYVFMCYRVQVVVRGQFMKLSSLLCLGNQTQVIRLGVKYLYLTKPSHQSLNCIYF